MKAIATISTVMILAAGVAVGQNYTYASQQQTPAAPASQSTTTRTAKSQTTTTAPAKLGAQSMAKPATTASAKPAAAKPAASTPADSSRGRRDPFVSPVIVRMGTGSETSCSTGKRCLIIDQLSVEGVVKTTKGWIAVLGNPAKKVYYVRENDALYDGYVMRITGDSVVFKQNVIDALGKSVQKEVVKRILPSA